MSFAVRKNFARVARPSRAVFARYGSSAHVEEFREPSGWKYGEKPSESGEQPKREAWEMPWYTLMFGGMAVFVVGHMLKPDYSLNTWAKEEAQRRIDAWEAELTSKGQAPTGAYSFNMPPMEIKKLLDDTADVEKASIYPPRS
eukprot:TRINITY_DN191_c0_g1_i1.p1 TRINITY_DN191_c0_g1~~TRINITY_DN191_c0_g1_i1.p1  ORF type:complete len:143 (+),score=56.64 TRINITY_DN191_c0_g1_i1:74-502(+)